MDLFFGAQSLLSRRILAVDDSDEITSLVADTFATVGARTVQANNGKDAMLLLMDGGFDVVILDMAMPQPDGWRVLQFMCRRTGWLERTIVMTANRWDSRVARAVRDYDLPQVFKPFSLSDLISAAYRVIGRCRPAPAA